MEMKGSMHEMGEDVGDVGGEAREPGQEFLSTCSRVWGLVSAVLERAALNVSALIAGFSYLVSEDLQGRGKVCLSD